MQHTPLALRLAAAALLARTLDQAQHRPTAQRDGRFSGPAASG